MQKSVGYCIPSWTVPVGLFSDTYRELLGIQSYTIHPRLFQKLTNRRIIVYNWFIYFS